MQGEDAVTREVVCMVSFFLCLALLIIGYFTYGKLVENTFGPDDRETPAVVINDGVDYVVLPQWKLFLIQLLNIAGLGPIFGALQGALWGPVVFLWITFGTIFAGGVHDFFSGMTSERNNGASVSEITGIYLGSTMKTIMRVFSVVLLVMVGTVFAVGPAGLIVKLCSEAGASGMLLNASFWLVVVLVYYFIATFISIDKIIGKIYPVFGICLIIMAVGVGAGLVVDPAYQIPELWDNFTNMHPKGTPIWAFMFITVACGAISGFHATQSPLMARCMKSEHQGHFVFYGAMVCEGIIALIWAAVAMAFFGGAHALAEALAANGNSAAWAVNIISNTTLGIAGGILALLGVVAAPITSGDTAFRSARLIVADFMGLEQRSLRKRIYISIPLFAAGLVIIFCLPFEAMWSYFAWMNQTLAMVTLWMITAYLNKRGRNRWVGLLPALVMTYVCMSYVFISPLMCGMRDRAAAYLLGGALTLAILITMIFKMRRDAKSIS